MTVRQEWDYVSVVVKPGESWYDVLRGHGRNGWEAWHIEKSENGWREIYFKRPRDGDGESSRDRENGT